MIMTELGDERLMTGFESDDLVAEMPRWNTSLVQAFEAVGFKSQSCWSRLLSGNIGENGIFSTDEMLRIEEAFNHARLPGDSCLVHPEDDQSKNFTAHRSDPEKGAPTPLEVESLGPSKS